MFCKHVYESVQAPICPTCGGDTHEPNWKEIASAHKKWVLEHPDFEYSWWSI